MPLYAYFINFFAAFLQFYVHLAFTTSLIMLKRERHAFILHQINLHNGVISTDLSQQNKVSDKTIRRDLKELAEAKKRIKVHGGALSNSFGLNNYSTRQVYSVKEKKVVAEKAMHLRNGGIFALTGARRLPSELNATIISGSIPAVLEYVHHTTAEVIVIGGKILKNARITDGMDAISQLKHLKADLCLLGIHAPDPENGVSDNDWEGVQFQTAMIDSPKKLICLTISEKINIVQPIQICDSLKIDTPVKGLSPEVPLLKPYRIAGINII